jgi:hypothetical protein
VLRLLWLRTLLALTIFAVLTTLAYLLGLLSGNLVNRGNPSAKLSSSYLDKGENCGLGHQQPRPFRLLQVSEKT